MMTFHSLLTKIGIVLLFGVLCLGVAGLGGAQEKYPTRTMTWISPMIPGNASDLCMRALCSEASKILGETIVFINKPGASHAIELSEIKNSKPDGYTIGVCASGGMSAQLVHKVPFDFRKDFTFIMQFLDYQQGVLVQTGAPWKTIQELIGYAKDNPGKIRMGVLGVGEAQHIAIERLSIKLGIKFNVIPLGQAGTAITNLLGGHVDAICSASSWVPNVEAGQLRLLAVCGGGDKRMAQFPNVPTLLEIFGLNVPGFAMIGGPKGLSPHIIGTLHNAFKKAMESRDFIITAEKFGQPIVYRGPEDATKYVHETFNTLADIVSKLGLRKE